MDNMIHQFMNFYISYSYVMKVNCEITSLCLVSLLDHLSCAEILRKVFYVEEKFYQLSDILLEMLRSTIIPLVYVSHIKEMEWFL